MFPRQLQFTSFWTQTAEVALSNVAQYNRRIGLFDFFGNLPTYVADMYRLYRYCRICAVDVTLKAVGETTSNNNFAFEAAMARVPYDEAASITPQGLRVARGGKYALAAQTGCNRLVISNKYGAFDELGNPVYDRLYWQNVTEASVLTPTDTARPVVAVALRSVLGNSVNVSVNLTVNYHLQFFDLELPPLTLEEPEIPKNPVNNKAAGTARQPSRNRCDDSDFDEVSERQSLRRR